MFGRALLLVPLLFPAVPGASVKDHVEAAKALHEKKDLRGALDRLADAIVLAHKTGDLLGEGEAAQVLDDLAREFPEVGPGKGGASAPQGPPHRREAMGLLMERLDPKRSGAFVSANALARNLVLLSTEHGDDLHRDKAEDVLMAWEKAGKTGEIAGFYTEWTITISSMNSLGPIGRGNTDGFVRLRHQILKAVSHGWANEVTHAVTELAAFYVTFADPLDGLDAMKQGEAACKESGDAAVVGRWQKAVKGTLDGAPEKLLEPLRRVVGKFEPTPAGAGGAGRPVAPTGLGLAFAKIKDKAPLVKVTRTDAGFDVVPAWNPKGKLKMPYGPGVRYLEADGLILLFEGKSVGLHAVDLEGRLAKPGDGSADLSFRSPYVLVRGESWTLRKDGSVGVER
jgi:hypothetical protein